jgi:hypothetical protein
MTSPLSRPGSLLVASVCVLALLASPTLAATRDVPSVGCPTVQTGIDSAAAGDTFLVACGANCEQDIVRRPGIRPAITLCSDQGATIDAQRRGRVMECYGVDASTLIGVLTTTGGYKIRLAGGLRWRNVVPAFEIETHVKIGQGSVSDLREIDSRGKTFNEVMLSLENLLARESQPCS